jgi:soluble lytic murein transglycosylase-like protein
VVAVCVALILGLGGGDDAETRRTSGVPAFVVPEKRSLEKTFVRAARDNDIPVALLEALCWRESRWRAEAFNADSGAVGIGQLLPETATYVANEVLHDPTLSPEIAVDNIRLTAAYVGILIAGFDGNERLALASYLQGSTSVRNEGVHPSTEGFLGDIVRLRKRFEAAARGDPGSARDPLND